MAKSIENFIKQIFGIKTKETKPTIPDNVFIQCPDCKKMVYKKKVDNNLGLCPECGFHFKISVEEWINILCDEESFQPIFDDLKSINILNFPEYTEKLNSLYSKKINEGITCGKAKIDGINVLIGIMDADFILGSMGSVVGERVTLLFEKGISLNQPVIILTRSGGARMQEGVVSLMQMAKTSAAIKKFSDSGNLYISILTDPTTGGTTASFAMLADIILAEPKALIGFAGPRVIEQTIKQTLPPGFQTAEFLLEKGFVDMVVTRPNIKNTISKILKIHKYR
ncbi:MAG: acetyl-CoA carboxylase, carboxyltransferase subunit beta [Spirochaetes bacterium]|nr:acetyl-CoA carboxylase, carboxyltransferase subunit beta [Spirochaetota bacterium]